MHLHVADVVSKDNAVNSEKLLCYHEDVFLAGSYNIALAYNALPYNALPYNRLPYLIGRKHLQVLNFERRQLAIISNSQELSSPGA